MTRAAHIKVRRLGLLYAHHGIDMGDGTVIHFVEKKMGTRAQIKRTSIDDFLKGGKLLTVRHKKALDPDETIRLAKTEMGKGDYHLVWNNCEHFATYCKTGKKKSKQVWRSVVGAASITLTATTAIIVHKKKKKAIEKKRHDHS